MNFEEACGRISALDKWELYRLQEEWLKYTGKKAEVPTIQELAEFLIIKEDTQHGTRGSD